MKARVLIIKCKQKEDELGRRNYVFGICEDATFRVPFICYKPYSCFLRDGVFEFRDCYVHEFDDKSLLLIVAERSSINFLPDEERPCSLVKNACQARLDSQLLTCVLLDEVDGCCRGNVEFYLSNRRHGEPYFQLVFLSLPLKDSKTHHVSRRC